MEAAEAAATMLETGVGRFRGPSLGAEMWAPLAVVIAAMATFPSLLGRLQVLILRLRSRGKEVISSHLAPYYSSGDDESGSDGEDEEESSDEASTSSCGEEEPERRIGYFEGAAEGLDGCLTLGGAVVRTWPGLQRRFSCAGGERFASGSTGIGAPAVRLWCASTASGEGSRHALWDAGDGGRSRAVPEAPVVVGWRREHAVRRRQRLLPLLPSPI